MKKLNIILVILICLLLPINVLAVSYGKTGAETNFDGDVGVPANFSYYVDGVEMVKFSKWDATVPPTLHNDIDEKYVPGSLWVDVTNDMVYICTDNTDGDAKWEPLTHEMMYVRADEAILKGQPVYVSGAQGAARPKVKLVDADLQATIRMIGASIMDIANGEDGFIMLHGLIYNVDTDGTTDTNPNNEAWVPGQLLYVMRDGSGGYTWTRPTSGRVIKAGYSLLGKHNTDTLLISPHVNAVDLAAAANEDIRMRLGDAIGGTKVTIKDFGDAEIYSLNSDGEIWTAGSIGFTVQTITSSSGDATIDWGLGNKARITLSEHTTLIFTDPASSGNYLLVIIQPAGDNAYTTAFPAGIYWSAGSKISIPLTNLNRSIVSFFFDDEDSDTWYCQGTEIFATDD